jgi:hypothetical protein
MSLALDALPAAYSPIWRSGSAEEQRKRELPADAQDKGSP